MMKMEFFKQLLKQLHSYYVKLSAKKKLLVFLIVFILGFICGNVFTGNKDTSRLDTEIGKYNNHENNLVENNNKRQEDHEEKSESEEPLEQEVIVVIDPGHGGEDLGTYHGSTLEKDLNLDISLKMGSVLEESGINVVYTRTEDKDVTLEERIFIANNLDATLFISVHNNAMPETPNYRGTETLFCPSQNLSNRKMDGEKLAAIVQKNLVNKLNTIDNGTISRPNLAVLRKTNMPAVIAEIAYLSNASDRENLKQDEFRQKAAQALADSVVEAIEVMEAKVNEDGVWIVGKE